MVRGLDRTGEQRPVGEVGVRGTAYCRNSEGRAATMLMVVGEAGDSEGGGGGREGEVDMSEGVLELGGVRVGGGGSKEGEYGGRGRGTRKAGEPVGLEENFPAAMGDTQGEGEKGQMSPGV